MAQGKWHKGPPPHVGWWNASLSRNPRSWRWWDGRVWSEPAWPGYSDTGAAAQAETEAHPAAADMQWRDYYPKRARVLRIDPRAVQFQAPEQADRKP